MSASMAQAVLTTWLLPSGSCVYSLSCDERYDSPQPPLSLGGWGRDGVRGSGLEGGSG